jgi:hypothetical protein
MDCKRSFHAGAHPRPRDAEGLERFLAEQERDGHFGVLLHGGEQAFPLNP